MKKIILAFIIAVFGLNIKAQIITTIAGNGTNGFSGDGGQATAAEFYSPNILALDHIGNLYFSDVYNNRLRKVNTAGIVSTIAGNGTNGFSGDGGQATAAELNFPEGIALDTLGNIYVTDYGNNRIRKINTTGIISTFAGNGTAGYAGDGGQATAANLWKPEGIIFDKTGNLIFADHYCIRKVTTAGIISTIAGNGTGGFAGDGGQATAAEMNCPVGLVFDPLGNLYFSDVSNNRVRMVTTSGIINTIAGDGGQFYSGDGGQATAARLYHPEGIVIDAIGNLYIADNGNNRIRMINTSGIISTIAGNGTGGYSGDGVQATATDIYFPTGVTFDATGNLYIADGGNYRVRMVSKPLILTVNSPNICIGATTTLTASGATSYTWSTGETTASIIVTPTATTQYSVTTDTTTFIAFNVSSENIGITTSTVTVFTTVPTLSLPSSADTICSGTSQTLFANGATSYTWSPATTLSDSSITNPIASPSTTTIYTITGSNACGYSSARTITVTVNPSPALVVNSATICAGNTTTLTASGANTYTWNTGDTTFSVITSPAVTTNYTISGTIGFCTSTASSTVMVNPSPVVTVNSATICAGDTAVLTAAGANTYTWNTTNTGPSITSSSTVTTTYTVTGINTSGCVGITTSTVTVYPTPTLTLNASSYTICAGKMDTLVVSGAITFSWMPASNLSSNTGSTVFANPVATTIYSVEGTEGSCSTINTVTITVNPSPSIPQLSNSNISYCQGSTYAPINVTGSGIILWSINSSMNPIINIGSSYTPPTTLPIGTTTYYLLDSSSVNGCINPNEDSVSVTIGVGVVPTVSFSIAPDTMPHVWDIYVNYSSNVANAIWYWGDGTNTMGLYVGHIYDSAARYNICVTAYNTCGDSANFCQNDSMYRTTGNVMIKVNVVQSTTGIQQIISNNVLNIYPNPNNGSFVIEPSNAAKQTMQVYDVNGKLVLTQTVIGKTNIDVSSLNEGVYNISIINGEGVVNKRLVIVR